MLCGTLVSSESYNYSINETNLACYCLAARFSPGHGALCFARYVGRSLRNPCTGVRASGIPQSHFSQYAERCRCGAATGTHTCFLRMPGLAQLGTWALAVSETGKTVPGEQVCAARARGTCAKSDARAFVSRERLRVGKGAQIILATLWHRLVTAVGCGT